MRVFLITFIIHFVILVIPLSHVDIKKITVEGQNLDQSLRIKIVFKKGAGKLKTKKTRIGSHKKGQINPKLYHPAPVYPRIAIIKGWQGKVLIRISSDSKGNINRKEILRSSGFNVLDQSALDIISKWKTIANLNNQNVPIVFKLKTRI